MSSDRSGAPVPIALLRRMSDVIAHRGPDGEGQYADGPVGLANRRLAIIDPRPEGDEPMVDATGDYVITYNGELYNYRELRERASSGPQAAASAPPTDTEVVLSAYAEWGNVLRRALQRHVRVRDLGPPPDAELFLARDRYGVKPLYYARASGRSWCSARRSVRS